MENPAAPHKCVTICIRKLMPLEMYFEALCCIGHGIIQEEHVKILGRTTTSVDWQRDEFIPSKQDKSGNDLKRSGSRHRTWH
mmetsp:Transcript_8840/g.32647  ORF Transcript_8840/g.32647 Transcript_8840/m.32647 type:complete len:82 (+) Transcript_8840:1271-1516(+)